MALGAPASTLRTEVFLIAVTIIFTVPYVIRRVGRTDYYAPLVVVQILTGILLGPRCPRENVSRGLIIFANSLLDKRILTSETFTALLLMAIGSTMRTIPMVSAKLQRMRVPDTRSARPRRRRPTHGLVGKLQKLTRCWVATARTRPSPLMAMRQTGSGTGTFAATTPEGMA